MLGGYLGIAQILKTFFARKPGVDLLSKIDESISLGEVISTVVEQRLPVAYLADGQKIPDNIEVAKAKALVSRAVVLASGQQARIKPVVLHSQHSDAV